MKRVWNQWLARSCGDLKWPTGESFFLGLFTFFSNLSLFLLLLLHLLSYQSLIIKALTTFNEMASTPHHNAPTPTSRPTWTPCSRMNNMTLNSRTGSNRTKIINNCRAPSFDVNQRFLEIACEDDDEPDHPNLTMVFNKHKISFDQLLVSDDQPVWATHRPPCM
jgi:hypothetical protein